MISSQACKLWEISQRYNLWVLQLLQELIFTYINNDSYIKR